jgi:hypothetical protein
MIWNAVYEGDNKNKTLTDSTGVVWTPYARPRP